MGLFKSKWPFFVNGVWLAGLVMLGLYLFDTVLGLGDAVVALSGYFQESAENGTVMPMPDLNGPLAMALGVLIGGLSGALMCGCWRCELNFSEYKSFGWKYLQTIFFGIAGGFLFMLGAQLAGEAFFGQLAAAMELAPGAWLYLIVTFAVAAALALLLERRRESGGTGGGDKK